MVAVQETVFFFFYSYMLPISIAILLHVLPLAKYRGNNYDLDFRVKLMVLFEIKGSNSAQET